MLKISDMVANTEFSVRNLLMTFRKLYMIAVSGITNIARKACSTHEKRCQHAVIRKSFEKPLI